MYFVRTPDWLSACFPQFICHQSRSEKVIYLTFDDGPIPEVTPWVMELLATYKAKATFFCVGDNMRKYPSIFEQLQIEGHAIGNHTFHHLDAWKTQKSLYLENVQHCNNYTKSSLFRPPYGHLTFSIVHALKQQYKIILWDVLSGDFDATISSEQCLKNILQHVRNGSIIVLHDSLKAEQHLRYVLPKVLAHFSTLGFRFERLN